MYAALTAAPVLASVLPTVLFVGMMMAAVVGVMSLVSRRDVYDEIERGDVSRRRNAAREAPATADAQEETEAGDYSQQTERELEIRQMLEARSARIVRTGGAPLDVEAEIAKLLAAERLADAAEAPPREEPDASAQTERELEIRQMLEARSALILRNGGAPLDVEAEMAKLLGGAPAAPPGRDRRGHGAAG